MSEAIINELPNEIIIAILRNIDQDSLKNAVLTCKLYEKLTPIFFDSFYK